ncbi:MAG: hypothetical protein LBL34_04145 [Clostridiales bacterium]|jgi:hypothetical protein|nr:hypothetical protein [Clostridiales bacterium]
MQSNGFVKGLVTGVTAGIVISTVINPLDSSDVRRINKGANKAFTTIGSIMDGVINTFK